MAHKQGATSNRRGGYGPYDRGTRGHGKDKAVKKAEKRANDARIQRAAEETRRAQEELERLAAQRAEEAVKTPVSGMHVPSPPDEDPAPSPALPQNKVQPKMCKRCGKNPRISVNFAWCQECEDDLKKQKEETAVEQAAKRDTCPVCGRENTPLKKDGSGFKAHYPWGGGEWCYGVDVSDPEPETPFNVPLEGEEKWEFAYTTARRMLKAGYNIKYVIEFTGVGYNELADIELDEDGYGIKPEEEEGE